jgi:1-phosphofructokinase family hexose kinase
MPARVITVTLNPALDMKSHVSNPRLAELNRARFVQLESSGKGINVARALQRQGMPVKAVAFLGGHFGTMLEAGLRLPDLELIRVSIQGETRCNVKVIDTVTGATTEFNAPGPHIHPHEIQALETALIQTTSAGDVVVFSGSLPANLEPDTYARLIELVRKAGAKAVLDADGPALRNALEAKPYLVKPNRLEAEVLLGKTIHSVQDAIKAARQIQSLGATCVVLSLGAEGAVFVADGEHHFVQPPPLRPRATVGCGDALLAGTLIARLRGQTWAQTARFATATAAARAINQTADFPQPHDVQALLSDVTVTNFGYAA